MTTRTLLAGLCVILLSGCSDNTKPSRDDALSQMKALLDKEGAVESFYGPYSDIKYQYLNGVALDPIRYQVFAKAQITVVRSKDEIRTIMKQHTDRFVEQAVEDVEAEKSESKGYQFTDNVSCIFLKTENGWMIQRGKACGATRELE